jgi:hypothetical protein
MNRAFWGAFGFLVTTIAFAQTPPKKPASIFDRLDQLEKKVALLEQMNNTLLSRELSTFATLDCDSHRYTELRPNGSYFLLFASCRNVEPYLEGHRVTIQVGNPYAIPVTQLSGKLWFGENLYQSFANNRNVEIPMSSGLWSGTWNTFVVNVNPSKAADLRSVMVEFTLSTVSLSNR